MTRPQKAAADTKSPETERVCSPHEPNSGIELLIVIALCWCLVVNIQVCWQLGMSASLER